MTAFFEFKKITSLFKKMNLIKSLIGIEDKKFELSGFIFDTNYQRMQLRSPIDQKATKLDQFELIRKKASLLRLDEEYVFKFKKFEKLCRDNFLDLLRKIKLQKNANVKVKFLFLDFETSMLFKRLITWLEIKEADISCLFIIDEDQVSNYLTQNGSLFYLISVNYLKAFEAKFFSELKSRKCMKSTIYIREQHDYLNQKQIKLINKFIKLSKSEVNYLNIFFPVNESVILLDNSISTLQYLISFLKSKKSFQESELLNNFKNQKLSNHLAYLLFKSNLNPSIRYLNNFNGCNRMTAESTFQILQKFYEDNNVWIII